MNESSTCPACGATLPPGTDLAECPRCLLAAGLADVEAAAPEATPDTPAPEEIADWFPQLEILEFVGRGGMGVVYKARQVSLDRIVALKILPSSISQDPAFADRFTREAKTMARLDHPNIVRIHEFGEAEGRYYLVMEFVDGSNLRQVMEAGGLEPTEALSIVPQVCEALQYAHDRGVVHRDIKPENVLIDRTGRVKITDFGLAKLVTDGPHEKNLTAFGQVMGTPQYMAPEQYRTPQDVDHRADIYSLGVVFYEMLTGEVPMGRFAPPSEKVEVDVRLDEVVLRTLEKERDRRYQRVDDVRTEVTSIVESPSSSNVATHSTPSAAPRREPPAPRPEARMSRLALFGFLCLPGVFLTPILGAVIGRLFGTVEMIVVISMGLAVLLLLVGFLLSIAGWVATSRSRGQLKGQGFAIAGTIAPVPLFLLLVGVMGLFLFTHVDEPSFEEFSEFPEVPPGMDAWEPEMLEDVPMPVPEVPRNLPTGPSTSSSSAAAGRGPTLIGVLEEAQDEIGVTLVQIEDLWAALAKLESGEAVTPDEAAALVAPVDRERIARARQGDLERLQAQGFLGLVMPPPSLQALAVHRYAIEEIDFTPLQDQRPYATVTAKADPATLLFDIVWNGHDWHYAIAPLKTSDDTSWDKPELVRNAPDGWSRNQQRNLQTHVELLWSIYYMIWHQHDVPLQARVPRDALQWLLPPENSESWKNRTSKALAEQGKDGGLGLLFRDATALGAPLADHHLKSVTVAEDGKTAIVVAAAGSTSFAFPIEWAEGRWWLSLGEVGR